MKICTKNPSFLWYKTVSITQLPDGEICDFNKTIAVGEWNVILRRSAFIRCEKEKKRNEIDEPSKIWPKPRKPFFFLNRELRHFLFLANFDRLRLSIFSVLKIKITKTKNGELRLSCFWLFLITDNFSFSPDLSTQQA